MGIEALTAGEWVLVIASVVMGIAFLAGVVLMYLSALIIAYRRNRPSKHYILAISAIFGVGSTLWALNVFGALWVDVAWFFGAIAVGIAVLIWARKDPRKSLIDARDRREWSAVWSTLFIRTGPDITVTHTKSGRRFVAISSRWFAWFLLARFFALAPLGFLAGVSFVALSSRFGLNFADISSDLGVSLAVMSAATLGGVLTIALFVYDRARESKSDAYESLADGRKARIPAGVLLALQGIGLVGYQLRQSWSRQYKTMSAAIIARASYLAQLAFAACGWIMVLWVLLASVNLNINWDF